MAGKKNQTDAPPILLNFIHEAINYGNVKEKKRSLRKYKFVVVADTLRKRVLNGDYAFKSLPSERKLAAELGVNYMTVRQGLRILEAENILIRQKNHRLMVKRAAQGEKPYFNLAFLAPSFFLPNVEKWRTIIERQTRDLPCNVRPVLYMHWDDPILMDVFAGFDGVFLYPIPEPVPDKVGYALRLPKHPIVVLGEDFSAYGVPSIELFQPSSIQKLLDHLLSLGHRRIGCFNTQPAHPEINERINQWRYWMAAHQLEGELLDHSVVARDSALIRAYQVMDNIYREGRPAETAWFCTTIPAAMGLASALRDHGLEPGKDVAVCSIDGEALASIFNPPLTSLESADPSPYVSICLKWLLNQNRGQSWQGPLLMTPVDVPLVVRESTRPGVGRGVIE